MEEDDDDNSLQLCTKTQKKIPKNVTNSGKSGSASMKNPQLSRGKN